MNKLHERLSAKYSWYRSWHAHIGPTIFTWTAFIIFAVSMASLISLSIMTIEVAYAEQVPLDPPAPLVVRTYPIKFFIDPVLVEDRAFAEMALPKYVADMNVILAKNTDRQLTFDPATGIIATTTSPFGGVVPSIPTDGYEVWAHVSTSSYVISYGGYMAYGNGTGAAGLEDLHWSRIFDPDTIAPGTTDMRDYWTQIDHMLHELAHTAGAGMGEYYNLALVNDTTGVAPLLNVNSYDVNDVYWGDKPDFMADPLLHFAYDNYRIGSPTSRAALLATVKFSNLTAAILRGAYRTTPSTYHPTADLTQVGVRIVDSLTGNPLPGVTVKVWQVNKGTGVSTLSEEGVSDGSGKFSFFWAANSYFAHNNYDFLRLIKVYRTGYTPVAKYVSVFDTDITRLIVGTSTHTVDIRMQSLSGSDVTPPTVSVTSPVDGALLSGAVTLSAAATDNVGVYGVRFLVDGVEVGTEATTSPYTLLWNSNLIGDGTHTLTAVARDSAGNVAGSAPVIIIIKNDTKAPTIPTNLKATVVSPYAIDLLWTASTDAVGVAYYQVYRCKGASCTPNIQVGTATVPVYSDSGLLPGSPYRYRVRAADASSNVSGYSKVATATTPTIPDTIAPSVLLTAPTSTARIRPGREFTLRAKATDDVAIAYVKFVIDDAVVFTDTVAAYTTLYTFPAGTSGNHLLSAVAVDTSGNTATSSLTFDVH